MDCLYFRSRPERDERLVCVHGFLGDDRSMDRVRALADGAFAHGQSLLIPGHAGAPWAPDGDFDATVAALNERVLGDRNVIVGYSMGARLALSMVLAAPQRYVGAVLVGVDPGIDEDAARDARLAWERSMSEKIALEGLDRFAEHWESLPVFASQRALPEEVRAELRARRSQHSPAAMAWAMRALGTGAMPSRWSALGAVSVPVVLLTGALDEKFTAIARQMAQRNARFAHRVVDGKGHDLTIEAPETVAQAARDVRELARSE